MKSINICLFGVLLAGSLASCTSNEDFLEECQVDNQMMSSPSCVETKALLAYENLHNALTTVATRGGEQKYYPEYYGGCYLGKNGKLVILVLENTGISRSTIVSMAKTDDIVIESCKYSYNLLANTMDLLNQFFTNPLNKTRIEQVGLEGYSLSEDKNGIIIKLKDCSKCKIEEFKKHIMDSPVFEFEESKGIPLLTVCKPGAAFGVTQGNAIASFGYRAKRNGYEGIVTAGHAISAGNSLYDPYQLAGYCEISITSGNVDAAWCYTYSSPSNITNYGTQLSNSVGSILLYSTAIKEGKTTGYTTGYITSTSTSYTFAIPGSNQTYYLTDIVETTYTCSGGDSGGVVYSYSNAVLGVHTGKSSDGTLSYFTKASNINTSLGLTMY